MNNGFSIYIHIPFCRAKCKYCNFVSRPANNCEINTYVDFLCDEICEKSNLFKNKVCKTIYFGGGTPSLIDDNLINKILVTIKKHYKLSKNTEISIECNPCTVTREKLTKYKSFGINRISFGVQSLNDDELTAIGRLHNSKDAINSILLAKEIGFLNISADVMIGIPNQTINSMQNTLSKLVDLGVNHISAYMLILEKETPLYKLVKDGIVTVANEDESVDMYNFAYNYLKTKGYFRYEISNFAKKGFKCRHNLNYWEMGEYIGFGVASHSYYDGRRISNSDSLEDYYKKENIFSEKITKKTLIEEMIMLGLRTSAGVSTHKLKHLGYDILSEKSDELEMLKKHKLISVSDKTIKVTSKNFGLVSAIILKLI